MIDDKLKKYFVMQIRIYIRWQYDPLRYHGLEAKPNDSQTCFTKPDIAINILLFSEQHGYMFK